MKAWIKDFILIGMIKGGWLGATFCFGVLFGMHLISYKIEFMQLEAKIKAINDEKGIVCVSVPQRDAPMRIECRIFTIPEEVNPV